MESNNYWPNKYNTLPWIVRCLLTEDISPFPVIRESNIEDDYNEYMV